MATNNSRSDKMPRGRYTLGGKTESLPTRIGWWDRTVFSKSDSDVEITIGRKYAHRPDLIAYDFYGSASLMWVVLQFNNIIDINTELVDGSVISLPTKARLYTQILSTNNN